MASEGSLASLASPSATTLPASLVSPAARCAAADTAPNKDTTGSGSIGIARTGVIGLGVSGCLETPAALSSSAVCLARSSSLLFRWLLAASCRIADALSLAFSFGSRIGLPTRRDNVRNGLHVFDERLPLADPGDVTSARGSSASGSATGAGSAASSTSAEGAASATSSFARGTKLDSGGARCIRWSTKSTSAVTPVLSHELASQSTSSQEPIVLRGGFCSFIHLLHMS